MRNVTRAAICAASIHRSATLYSWLPSPSFCTRSIQLSLASYIILKSLSATMAKREEQVFLTAAHISVIVGLLRRKFDSHFGPESASNPNTNGWFVLAKQFLEQSLKEISVAHPHRPDPAVRIFAAKDVHSITAEFDSLFFLLRQNAHLSTLVRRCSDPVPESNSLTLLSLVCSHFSVQTRKPLRSSHTKRLPIRHRNFAI